MMKANNNVRVSVMSLALGGAGAAMIALGVIATPTAALAVTCPVSLIGKCSTTDPGDPAGFKDIDQNALTFLATLNPKDQNPATVTLIVDTFLAANGFATPTYLGRVAKGGTSTGTGNGGPSGTKITVGGNPASFGMWSFDPGATGLEAGFIALHAGLGKTTTLFEINAPLTNSGVWDTSENEGKGLSNFDLYSGAAAVPGPVVGAGLPGLIAACGGLLALARRRRQLVV
jgi:hypothetical protein